MSIIFTVSQLALTINKSSRVYLFQQAQCLIYYQVNDSTKIDSENGVNESLCKLEGVQHPLSITVGIDAILLMLPGKVPCPILFLNRLLDVHILTKLDCSAASPWYLSAALAKGWSAKSFASELVLLSHRRFSIYLCV